MSETVRVEDLTVQFGDFKAVKDISFRVSKGEIFGFLGANGAGKTTTIRVLCGLLKPSSGKVSVLSKDVQEKSMEVKASVGYMSQKFTLYDDLTVRENLNFAAALHGVDKGALQEKLKTLYAFVTFKRDERELVRDLPAGIKQKIALVATLLHEPDVVFLDEPTAGVTPSARKKFWDLIRSLAEEGKTVFVTTHYMDEAEECGRIALMRTGEIIELGTPQELKEKYFPNQIIELTPQNDGNLSTALEELQSQDWVESLMPYGTRFHLVTSNLSAFSMFRERHLSQVKVAKFPAALEDVFIRAVEGKER